MQITGTINATVEPYVSMMYPVIAAGIAPPRFSAEIDQANTSVVRLGLTERSATANPAVSRGAIPRPVRNSAIAKMVKLPVNNCAAR